MAKVYHSIFELQEQYEDVTVWPALLAFIFITLILLSDLNRQELLAVLRLIQGATFNATFRGLNSANLLVTTL